MSSTMMPLLILSEDGRVMDAGFSSEKAYSKSLEQGSLWVVHADTERVLPYESGHTLHHVKKHGHYVVAILEAGDVSADTDGAVAVDAASNTESADHPAEPEDVRSQTDPRATEAAPHASERVAADAGAGNSSQVFERLEQIVRSRKRELPEGSYTTHLFTEGGEKIRKKLGEEAVELLLAASRERTVSESADLLYHLMVLLASEEIEFSEILEELSRRG